MLKLDEIVDIKTETVEVSDDLFKLYGFGYTLINDYIVYKKKQAPIPGCILLFELGCKATLDPVLIQDPTIFTVGDVVSDFYGDHWLIKTIEWV